MYRGKEKRNESFLFFSVVVPKSKPSKRKIYSKCLLETFRVRGNVEGDRTEVDICRFLGRHSEFLAPRSRVHCESLVDKHRGSSIFSLANFNESANHRDSYNFSQLATHQLPHIRPSPRKRLLPLFLENIDENQIEDRVISIPLYFN